MNNTKIFLDTNEVFFIKASAQQVADLIDDAKQNGKSTVVFTGRGDREQGFRIERIVRWEQSR